MDQLTSIATQCANPNKFCQVPNLYNKNNANFQKNVAYS